MLQMMAVRAETERDMISERTRLALAVKKAGGMVLGNPRIDEARQKAIKSRKTRANSFANSMYAHISSMQSRGLSCRKIADRLNQSQFKTTNGGYWWPTTVANIVKRGEAASTSDDLFE